MVQQSPIDEQIREYLLQQGRIDKARRQPASISQERRKWERRLGYFILAGVVVVVFALNEYFPGKPSRLVLIALGSGALAFLGALTYVNGFIWVMEKLGYSRAWKLQTKPNVNWDRFLCAVGCVGLRGIQRTLRT